MNRRCRAHAARHIHSIYSRRVYMLVFGKYNDKQWLYLLVGVRMFKYEHCKTELGIIFVFFYPWFQL